MVSNVPRSGAYLIEIGLECSFALGSVILEGDFSLTLNGLQLVIALGERGRHLLVNFVLGSEQDLYVFVHF